jgi:hypothetical protein
MTQIDPKLQRRWERILKTRGLGIVQPMTDNSEGEMAQVELSERSLHGDGKDTRKWDKLRGKIDGSDGFMGGHQITKIRSMEREVPEWSLNDSEVQRILLLAFPKLQTRPRQRARAGMYARIIHLYWRMKLPQTIVAREMGISEMLLRRKIQTVARLARGLDNKGAPRKRGVTPPTPGEGTTEGRHETIKGPFLHRAGDGSNGEDGTPQKDVPMPQAG